MIGKLKRGGWFAFVGIFLLIISILLTLAITQAISLVTLRLASTSSGIEGNELMNLGLWLRNELVILGLAGAILFYFVFKQPRRLLLVTLTAALVFVMLNLFSGRHLLPQLLIRPSPLALAEQYIQALSRNDLEAALELTNHTTECETRMLKLFEDHQARLTQIVNNGRSETTIQAVSVKNITTFYDKPVPGGLLLLPPEPNQLVTVLTETQTGRTMWLELKMSYHPIWGQRYICGQDITSEI